MHHGATEDTGYILSTDDKYAATLSNQINAEEASEKPTGQAHDTQKSTEVLDNFETFAGLYLGARIEKSGGVPSQNALQDPSFTPSHSDFEFGATFVRLTSFQN